MPKGNYRIEPLRERKLRAQVRDLEERLAALSADPSAKREIAHLKGVIASLEETVARLESEAIDQHARYTRLKERLGEAQSRSREAQAAQKAAEHAAKDARKAIGALQKRVDDAAAGRLRLLEENRAQAARIGELEAELARKQALIEHLNARLSRGPENSSVPPSADPNRKRIPNSRTRSGRKPGGQLGHRGHGRKSRFPDAEVILEPENTCCPRCGCETCATGATRTHTVTDIELITKTTAYISSERACPHCGKTSWDAFPKGVENEANYGPGVKSAIAYLVGACNVSGANARDFLKQMSAGEVDVSSGSVANFMAQFSRLSEGDRQAIFDAVATSPVIGSDATFTRAEGASSYVYVFHAGDAAVFSANRTKGHAAIKGSPLEAAPDATLVHDHDTSYYSYGARHGECNVHILRYLKGVAENEPGQFWAQEMTGLLCRANDAAKAARKSGTKVDAAYIADVERAYKEILEGAIEGYAHSGAMRSKYPPEGVRLARRMRKYAKNHLLFLHDTSVPFDNNKSERLLRQAKKKVKQSGGFRSTENGEQPYCDFLTVVETAKMREIPPMQAVRSVFEGEGGLFEQ